jgi:hypothetical protein
MKELTKLALSFLAGFLAALGFLSLLNKSNSVDPVKLAEYSACLNYAGSNYNVWDNSENWSWDRQYITSMTRPLKFCEGLKP